MHFLSMLQEYMIPDFLKRLNSIGHVNTEIWIKYLNISIGIQYRDSVSVSVSGFRISFKLCVLVHHYKVVYSYLASPMMAVEWSLVYSVMKMMVLMAQCPSTCCSCLQQRMSLLGR